MNEFQLFVKLGWQHILSFSSWDHLLFLIALIVVFELKEYKKIILLISLFTLAHTTSLLLSAYHLIKVDENLIEQLILYTILITALSNLFLSNQNILHKVHYYFSFLFGLIHGLGFARDFKMMIAGQKTILFPVLEFTLGIEAAQIVFAIVFLVAVRVLYGFSAFKKNDFVKIVSALIIGYVLAKM